VIENAGKMKLAGLRKKDPAGIREEKKK